LLLPLKQWVLGQWRTERIGRLRVKERMVRRSVRLMQGRQQDFRQLRMMLLLQHPHRRQLRMVLLLQHPHLQPLMMLLLQHLHQQQHQQLLPQLLHLHWFQQGRLWVLCSK